MYQHYVMGKSRLEQKNQHIGKLSFWSIFNSYYKFWLYWQKFHLSALTLKRKSCLSIKALASGANPTYNEMRKEIIASFCILKSIDQSSAFVIIFRIKAVHVVKETDNKGNSKMNWIPRSVLELWVIYIENEEKNKQIFW